MTVPPRIDALRRALALTPAEEDLVRRSVERLAPQIEGWIERFYARLVGDPVAMGILGDEGRVIRLKRSLTAWLHEVFALPLDADYERTRREIGLTHVRVGMPEYLMVTSMGGLRRDVTETIAREWGETDPAGWRVRSAVGKVLDLELALMLEAYGRRSRELVLRRDRALHAERMARRSARATRDAVDAATCWLELLAREGGGDREGWAARLREVLRSLSAPSPTGTGGFAPSRPVPTRLADLCARAVQNVSVSSYTTIEVAVVPPDLAAEVHEGPLQLALEEILQGAVHHAPGGMVSLSISATGDRIVFEITDEGPGWPAGVRTVEAAAATEEGVGLSYGEFVADLHGGSIQVFEAAGRGAGVRLELPERPRSVGTPSDETLAQDLRRGPP